MSTLNTLKLVAAKPQRENNPVIQRRQKLLAKLDEQIALAAAKAAGTVYTAMRSKRVKDEAGNVTVVQQPKRVKAWFWAVDGGKVCVVLRYGNKVMELAKGKTGVETNAIELEGVLITLKKIVECGELDTQIEAVSAGVRRGFKRG